MRAASVLALMVLAAAAAQGQVFGPRVTSEHNADTTDLARFRRFHAWKDKEGTDLAIAIWKYLCDNETGVYHFYEVQDGPDPYAVRGLAPARLARSDFRSIGITWEAEA